MHVLMTRKSCAVGMRNAILRNYLNQEPCVQRKRDTDFDLLFDSIGATGFLWGYTVPIFQLQFVGGFTGSSFGARTNVFFIHLAVMSLMC